MSDEDDIARAKKILEDEPLFGRNPNADNDNDDTIDKSTLFSEQYQRGSEADRSDDLAAITKLKLQLRQTKSRREMHDLMGQHHATITIDHKFYIIQELGDTINLITEDTFIKQFRNCKFAANEGEKAVNIAVIWLNSVLVRECSEFVFDPQHEYDPNSPIFNKWRGFGTQAKEGDCSAILSYYWNDICDGDKHKFEFMMGWCAHMFQKPWEKPEVAFALTGPKGIGKSLFFWILNRLLDGKSRAGRAQKYYHKVSKSKGLLPRFNVHLEENILLVSEEVSLIGDRELRGAINDFITSDTISIEIKNGPIRDVKSYSRMGITINDEHFVKATNDERRYAIFKVSDAHQGNKPYFRNIITQLNSGGAEALMYLFKRWDISEFDPRKYPETAELGEQKVSSLAGVELWWFNKISSGRLPLFEKPIAGHNGPCKIITEKLQDDYLRSEKDPWLRTIFSKESFGKQLRKLCPDIEKNGKIPNELKYGLGSKANWVSIYTVPSLGKCRVDFVKSQNVKSIQWDEGVTEWDGDLNWIVDGPF